MALVVLMFQGTPPIYPIPAVTPARLFPPRPAKVQVLARVPAAGVWHVISPGIVRLLLNHTKVGHASPPSRPKSLPPCLFLQIPL